jgi:phosphoserine aminotransferase
MPRIHNFNAGPAALPTEVLEEVRDELLDYQSCGTSIMETSHRGKQYDQVHEETITLVKELMNLGDNYNICFLQGGASMQFAMIPMNLLASDQSADYLLTGSWSKKAIKEAKILGTARTAADTEHKGVFTAIPKADQVDLDANASYCHITSNNTIYGTQWQNFPDTGNVPLIGDMSSDIMSRTFDPNPFGIIYAGAQKNLGPSGVALIIIRDDILKRCNQTQPTMLRYQTYVDNNSLYNTPPTFGIYVMNRVLNWIKNRGGVAEVQKENEAKAKLLYSAIDNSNDYYKNSIAPQDRSAMNVVFNLASEDLEKKFITESLTAGFSGIKGHRSIGGIRVSIYNASRLNAVEDMVKFMTNFTAKNG